MRMFILLYRQIANDYFILSIIYSRKYIYNLSIHNINGICVPTYIIKNSQSTVAQFTVSVIVGPLDIHNYNGVMVYPGRVCVEKILQIPTGKFYVHIILNIINENNRTPNRPIRYCLIKKNTCLSSHICCNWSPPHKDQYSKPVTILLLTCLLGHQHKTNRSLVRLKSESTCYWVSSESSMNYVCF